MDSLATLPVRNTLPVGTIVLNRIRRLWDRIILWVTSVGFSVALTLFLSLFRQRMSHNNGICARGSATIVSEPTMSLPAVFRPGQVFPCRIRHAAASFMDDAMRVVRSMSIKFADTQYRSPFDLELNTGEVALFWSAASFFRFAKYKRTRHGIQYHQYYRNYPAGMRGAHPGMRRNPTSFTNQHYYAQTPLRWRAADGVARYAKYRVIPHPAVPETGRLDAADMLIPTENQRVLPGEQRSRNYLKEEFARRVAREGASYMLQVQLHTAQDDDSPEIFNCCAEWEERSHPWHDLAVIRATEVLDWRESCLTAFSLANLPRDLGMIPAKNLLDYNSLNYLRRHSELARVVRIWSCRVFGVPPEIPDDDDRNQ
jgi:catalase